MASSSTTMIDLTEEEEEEEDKKIAAKNDDVEVFEIVVDSEDDSEDEVIIVTTPYLPIVATATAASTAAVIGSSNTYSTSNSDYELALKLASKEQAAAAAASSTSTSNRDYELALKIASKEQPSGNVMQSQYLPSKRQRGAPFDCKICLEDQLSSFKGYSIDACKHRFCISCLTELVKSAINSASATTIKIICPEDKCNCTLSVSSDIRFILQDNPVCWKEYSEKANLCALEAEVANQNSDTRRCPSQRCNFIFVFTASTAAEGTRFDCPSCSEQFCLQCGANDGKVGPAHVGSTCYERKEELTQKIEERRKFQEWQTENNQADTRFNELMTQERKRGTTKACPKCNTPITKNGGCSHMTCTNCRSHFSWEGGENGGPKLMPGSR